MQPVSNRWNELDGETPKCNRDIIGEEQKWRVNRKKTSIRSVGKRVFWLEFIMLRAKCERAHECQTSAASCRDGAGMVVEVQNTGC